jgi:two-component system, cell cycle response regulator
MREKPRLRAENKRLREQLEMAARDRAELERSQSSLRQNVARLGDALERTHDLDGLLSTVLQAAASATESQLAIAWLIEGDSVVARASAPPGRPASALHRVALGTNLAGEVAADGRPRRLSQGQEDVSTVLGGPALAAPLRRGHSVLGVLVVEREPSLEEFNSDDEAMLASLAGPTGIAVDNVLLHREAQRYSVTDDLTGAANLRHMSTVLTREVGRAAGTNRPLAVLALDIDDLKIINDTHGHLAGGMVLREMTRRVASVLREVDTVARSGGDEFIVVAPDTDSFGAERLAEHVCEVIRQDFMIGDISIGLTVSVGIAVFPTHGSQGGDLLRAADDAMYNAKEAGKNQWRTATVGGYSFGRLRSQRRGPANRDDEGAANQTGD